MTRKNDKDPELQSSRFIRIAREPGCDEDSEAFKRVVKKLARQRGRSDAP
jgi:hypothetical protein